MFEKFVDAITPFGLTAIVIAGASLAEIVKFSNSKPVGVVVMGFGILFIIAHVVRQVKAKNK